MEITEVDTETTGIRLRTKEEYSKLYGILRVFALELEENNIDLEALMFSKESAESFLKDFFAADERELR